MQIVSHFCVNEFLEEFKISKQIIVATLNCFLLDAAWLWQRDYAATHPAWHWFMALHDYPFVLVKLHEVEVKVFQSILLQQILTFQHRR